MVNPVRRFAATSTPILWSAASWTGLWPGIPAGPRPQPSPNRGDEPMKPDQTTAADPPIALKTVDLAPASCVTCRCVAWCHESAQATDGRALLFDLARINDIDVLASVHPCCLTEDLEAENADDPDWGWLTD